MSIIHAVVLTAPLAGLPAHDSPPAFVKIDGRESLLRSVDLFANRDSIKQVHVVVDAAALDSAKSRYGAHFAFTGVKLAGASGPHWFDQLAAADAKIPPEVTHVLIHDGARPSVPSADIDALLEAADGTDAAALAVALCTPVVETDPAHHPVALHAPGTLHQLLTPAIYRRAEFASVAKTRRETHASKLRLVPASPLNVRVTSIADEKFVRTMLTLLPRPKVKAGGAFDEAQW